MPDAVAVACQLGAAALLLITQKGTTDGTKDCRPEHSAAATMHSANEPAQMHE